jgi:PAS domain S-box-containing protein
MTPEYARSNPVDDPSRDSRYAPEAGSEQALRKRAEALVGESAGEIPENLEALSPETAWRALHELRVHQIELEMQNVELRRAQEELEDSRARYFDLYDLAPVGYFTLSERGLILEVNLTAAQLLGVARSALVKQPLSRFILAEDEDIHYRCYKQLLETGAPQSWELRFLRKDAAPFWARVEAAMAQDAGGAFECRAVVSDITERKAAEQQTLWNAELEQRVRSRTAALEAANKELEAFAYSVAHDLRAPLRGIDGWSLALLEDYGAHLDAQAREHLDRVRSEAQHMGRLIDGLLQLSRVARAQIVPRAIDLTALAQTVAARLREAHPGRLLEFVIGPGLTGTGDAPLLEVALTNLLDNAVKFTHPRAQARIEFGKIEQDRETAFFVRDNGVGFDMRYAGLLFGTFQRLHKTAEFPGTGIGLATVQRVIHRHGGRVWAEARVGEGASFYFTLGVDP